MKSSIKNPRSAKLAVAAMLALGAAANAAEYTWDTSTTTGYQAANGIWGTDTYWTTNGGTTLIAWANSAHTATFAGTGTSPFTVQLSANAITTLGSATTGALNFTTDGYTLQSNSGSLTRTITIGTANTAGFITIGSSVTATIGDRVKVTKSGTGGELNLYGGGTLVIGSGTAGGGASLDTTNGANASFINANSTLEVKTGGTATYGTSLGLGNTTTGGGTVKITGGDLKLASTGSNLILQNAAGTTATSTITMSNGSIEFTNTGNTGGIRFGPAGGSSNPLSDLTGTLNLDGGIATINKIYMGGAYTAGAKYTAVVNLNGGTLKALTNQANFFEGITNSNNNSTASGAFVKANGAKFDSNGKAITVAQVLQSGVAGPALDGGLTLNDTAVTKGTLTLSAANSYTGGTNINSGTLEIGNAAALGTSGTIAFGGGTLKYGTGINNDLSGRFSTAASQAYKIHTNGNDVNLATALTSSGGTLYKDGNGKLTLNGGNSMNGATTVAAGVLAVNGTLSATTVTVQTGGTLGGSGTIAGAVTVQGGGTLAPGNSIDSLDAATVSFASSGTFAVEINSTAETNDLLTLTSGVYSPLAITNGALLTLTELDGTTTFEVRDRLTLIDYAASGGGTWTGGLFTYGTNQLIDGEIFTALGYSFAINYDDTSNAPTSIFGVGDLSNGGKYLTLTVVPEPTATTFGLLALGGLLLRRRRNA